MENYKKILIFIITIILTAFALTDNLKAFDALDSDGNVKAKYKICSKDSDCSHINYTFSARNNITAINIQYLNQFKQNLGFSSYLPPSHQDPKIKCIKSEHNGICHIIPDNDNCMAYQKDGDIALGCMQKCLIKNKNSTCKSYCSVSTDGSCR